MEHSSIIAAPDGARVVQAEDLNFIDIESSWRSATAAPDDEVGKAVTATRHRDPRIRSNRGTRGRKWEGIGHEEGRETPRNASILVMISHTVANSTSLQTPGAPAVWRSRRRIAIVIAHGPEVRGLIHSGLLARLAATNDVTILTSNPESIAFRQVPPEVTVQAIPGRESAGNGRWRNRVLRLNRSWLEAQGRQKWSHRPSPAQPSRGLARWLVRRLATDRVLSVVVALEQMAGSAFGTDRDVASCLEALGIDLLLTCTYNSTRVRPLLQTARNLGISTIVTVNSWKDVYVQSHVSVPISRLLLWSESEVAEFTSRNPFFPPGRTLAVGSLHLAALARENPLPRKEFCARYSLDPDRPIVCYSAAAPDAVAGEVETVRELVERLISIDLSHRPQLLIRANPMEDGSRFSKIAADSPDVVIQRPEWEWNPDRDWCCALATDLRLWASTIAHSIVNISIPSTVTLEFLAWNRPVLNICFDAEGRSSAERSAERFWDAEFYRPIRNRPGVHGASSADELLGFLETELRAAGGAQYSGLQSVAQPVAKNDAVDCVLDAINGVLAERIRA